MTYATGSATTVDNLMSALFTFAVANAGMTLGSLSAEQVPAFTTDPAHLFNRRSLTKGGRSWDFLWNLVDFRCRPGLADSSAWESVAVKPAADSVWFPLLPPFTSYHLFTEGSVVHLAVEMSNGGWTHMNFGDVTKYASFTGGHYLSITSTDPGISVGNTDNYKFCLFGSFQDNGIGGAFGTQSSSMYIPYNGRDFSFFVDTLSPGVLAAAHTPDVIDTLIANQPNVFNGRVFGPRLELFLYNDASGGSRLLMPLGYVPNLRAINIRDLNAKDLVNTDWMIFPCQGHNSFVVGSYANTFDRGWAVRK
jgi:hypothetical protein